MKKILLTFLLVFPLYVDAAVLSLEPQDLTLGTKKDFSIEVTLSSTESINAVEAAIVFPAELVPYDTFLGNSVIPFFIDQPIYDAETRTLSFSGIVPGGYVGERGRVLTILARPSENIQKAEVFFDVSRTKVYLHEPNTIESTVSVNNLKLPVAPGKENLSLQTPDTEEPNSFIPVVSRTPLVYNNAWFVTFEASDKQSGISHYDIAEVKEGFFTGREVVWVSHVSSPYLLQDQSLQSVIHIKAVDRYGNEKVVTLSAQEEHIIPNIFWVILIGMIAVFIGYRFIQKKIFSLLFFLVFLIPISTHAADLSITPGAQSLVVGQTATLYVMMSEPNKDINAVSGVLTYDPKVIEVTGISKDSTIINAWVKEPAYSNTSGQLSFEGVVFNPGYRGIGRVLAFTLKAKGSGSSKIVFQSGSVLANDGQGTELIYNLVPATIEVTTTQTIPGSTTETARTSVLTPVALQITSRTNPNNKASNTSSPEFSWKLGADITAVRMSYDTKPSSTPTVLYSPPISSKKLEKVADGTYYFHLQAQNKYGWGAISHYKFQIDTKAPDPFQITFPHGKVGDEPRPVIYFNTTDAGSGISYYEVKIGEKEFERVDTSVVDSNPYTPPAQEPGKRTIIVRAIDEAGNETVATSEFTITALKAPEITAFNAEITEGDLVKIKGITYPASLVDITIINTDSGIQYTEQAKSNTLGDFTHIWSKHLNPGLYSFTAKVIDERGAQSEPSPEHVFSVKPGAFIRIGSVAASYASLLILIALLVTAIIIWLLHMYHMVRRKHTKIQHVAKRLYDTVSKDFDELREIINEHVTAIKKVKSIRELTKEEAAFIAAMHKHTNSAERDIKGKVRDIE